MSAAKSFKDWLFDHAKKLSQYPVLEKTSILRCVCVHVCVCVCVHAREPDLPNRPGSIVTQTGRSPHGTSL